MAVDLSIIVPCRGRGGLLRLCLASLMTQKTVNTYEVIAVYCKSDLEVQEVLKGFQIARTITSKDWLSAGQARNLGADHAQADFIAFIDSDCIVDSNWVTHALETLQHGAVLCSGVIKDALPWNMISSADNRLQYADFAQRRPFGKAAYFPGPHLAMQKKVFYELGGFPPQAHGQDVLFTLQAVEQYGDRVIFNPNLSIKHYGRDTWREFLQHQKRFGISRSQEQIQFKGNMAWLSRHRAWGWVVFMRRLIYITARVFQWNIFDVPRYFLHLPAFLIGLAYWVKGFYEGVQNREMR